MPPMFSSAPFVFTIHDLIHLHFGNPLHRAYYDYAIRPLARRAVCVLTVSEHSRQEILEWSGLSPEKVVSIPLGVGSEFCSDGEVRSSDRPYILYVGNRRIYKNLPRLIRAFAAAEIDSAVTLALTGDYDAELHAIASNAGVAERVVFLGAIPEVDLPGLYRGALVLVYVSIHEGFGLPPLEAMACGTPVVVSNTTSLPEVVGEAALLVDPLDEAVIAGALGRAVNDAGLRFELKKKGLEQAKKFSWDRCAVSTWQRLVAAARP